MFMWYIVSLLTIILRETQQKYIAQNSSLIIIIYFEILFNFENENQFKNHHIIDSWIYLFIGNNFRDIKKNIDFEKIN